MNNCCLYVQSNKYKKIIVYNMFHRFTQWMHLKSPVL